jgi:hypothetical protein
LGNSQQQQIQMQHQQQLQWQRRSLSNSCNVRVSLSPAKYLHAPNKQMQPPPTMLLHSLAKLLLPELQLSTKANPVQPPHPACPNQRDQKEMLQQTKRSQQLINPMTVQHCQMDPDWGQQPMTGPWGLAAVPSQRPSNRLAVRQCLLHRLAVRQVLQHKMRRPSCYVMARFTQQTFLG